MLLTPFSRIRMLVYPGVKLVLFAAGLRPSRHDNDLAVLIHLSPSDSQPGCLHSFEGAGQVALLKREWSTAHTTTLPAILCRDFSLPARSPLAAARQWAALQRSASAMAQPGPTVAQW